MTFTLKDRRLCDLTHPEVATLIVQGLRHFGGQRYWLHEYTVMPDHVHAIIQPIAVEGVCEPLERITQSLKGWTAYQINRSLGRSGALWLDETYDHMIRSPEDHRQTARYIWMNPVAWGLVHDPADWPWWGHGARDHELG